MDGASSFRAHRQATGLAAFPATLPPPVENIPRATSDGLSPSLSAVTSGSSQSSSASAGINSYYGGTVQTQWNPATSNSSYTFSSSSHAQPTLAQPGYGNRGIYSQSPAMHYGQRSSQSPATAGEGPHPPYEHHQPFQTPIPGGGGGGHVTPSLPSQGPAPQVATLSSHSHDPTPSLPPVTASSSTQVDSYGHSTRPPTTPSYYATTSNVQQPAYTASYAPHPSPTIPTTMGSGSRNLPSTSGMAAPQPYAAYGSRVSSYLSPMSGPIMSNMGNPGGQMALVHGLNMPSGYGNMAHSIYSHGHGHSASPQERPFKCDVCPQSFNRNHDLKRHKRIHLAVKPFPCTYCEKSFSRKDALKRHRLVKGCGTPSADISKPQTESNAKAPAPGTTPANRSEDGNHNFDGTRGRAANKS